MKNNIVKINKNSNFSREKHLKLMKRFLFSLTALGSTAAALVLTACAPKVENPLPTQEATISATDTANPVVGLSNEEPTKKADLETPSPTSTPAPVLTPAIKKDLTNEEIIELFDMKNPEEVIPINALLFIYYEIPGKNPSDPPIPQIAFLDSYNAKDEKGNEIRVARCLWSEKDVFSIKETGDYLELYLDSAEPVIINEKFKSLSPKILWFAGEVNLALIFEDRKDILSVDQEEYTLHQSLFMNVQKFAETKMSKIDFAKMILGFVNYDVIAKADSFDETLVVNTPDVEASPYVPTSYKSFTSKDGRLSLSYPFNSINQSKTEVDYNVVNGYRNPNYYNETHTVTRVNHPYQYAKTRT